MERFSNSDQVIEFAKDAKQADSSRKGDLERSCLMGCLYYNGQQWGQLTSYPRLGITRLDGDFDPDSARLRVTTNRVARLIQKAAVTTFPEKIEIQVFPPDRDASPEANIRAQVYEYALSAGMDSARFVAAARNANFHRAIWGSYGIGIRCRFRKRKLSLYGSEVEAAESDLGAFDFPVTDLTLDPATSARDLREHEFVIHESIWSAAKIKEWLDIALDPDDLEDIGKLAAFQMSANTISDNQLYARYRSMSKVKGAVIKQIHLRDETGRFPVMYVVLETKSGRETSRVINMDNPASPFGGCGLPLALIHGHRRTDGPFGMSDASMLKDNQDKVNLADTFKFRGAQGNTQWNVLFDRNTIGRVSGDEAAVRDSMSNLIGGPIFYTSGTRDRPGNAPQIVAAPPVPSYLFEMKREYEDAMLDDVHRAPVNMGVTKSHVPNQVVQASIDQADQVLGVRVLEDKDAYEHLAEVVLGTTILQVREMSPCTLGLLKRRGFTDDDFATLSVSDPYDPGASVKVRESSIRFQSPAAKKQALNDAVMAKVIDAQTVRLSLARDTDMALTSDDRYYSDQAERAADRVLRGEDWEPISLGNYAYMFIEAFRRAMLSEPARRDPNIRRRLNDAVQSQQMLGLQEMALANAALQPGAGGAPGQGAAPAEENPTEAAFSDVVSALESSGAAA